VSKGIHDTRELEEDYCYGGTEVFGIELFQGMTVMMGGGNSRYRLPNGYYYLMARVVTVPGAL